MFATAEGKGLNKQDKPLLVELTRGAVLPSELKHIVALGTQDANCMIMTVVWSDNSHASTTDIDEIEPIEDVEGIRSVFAKFHYNDGSNLTIWLRQYYCNIVEAVGKMSLQRQSSIAQYWASLPDRSSPT